MHLANATNLDRKSGGWGTRHKQRNRRADDLVCGREEYGCPILAMLSGKGEMNCCRKYD
jgi:hypothetical protein